MTIRTEGLVRNVQLPTIPSVDDTELYSYLTDLNKSISDLYTFLTYTINSLITGGSAGEKPQTNLSFSHLPVEGRVFFDQTSNVIYYDEGSAWTAIQGTGFSSHVAQSSNIHGVPTELVGTASFNNINTSFGGHLVTSFANLNTSFGTHEITSAVHNVDGSLLGDNTHAFRMSRGYFSNLQIHNNTGAKSSYAINITADVLTLKNASNLSIRISNVNISNLDLTSTGANGLDTGSEELNKFYYAWVIYDSTNDRTAGVFSSLATSPVLPSGYTYERVVGGVHNLNGDIVSFYQNNDFYTRTEVSGGYWALQDNEVWQDMTMKNRVPTFAYDFTFTGGAYTPNTSAANGNVDIIIALRRQGYNWSPTEWLTPKIRSHQNFGVTNYGIHGQIKIDADATLSNPLQYYCVSDVTGVIGLTSFRLRL